MQNFLEAGATPLAVNETVFYYRLEAVDIVTGPKVRLKDLTRDSDADMTRGRDILPPDQLSALQDRYANAPVWAELGAPEATASDWFVSHDLAPSIRAVLKDKKRQLTSRWSLTETGLRLATRASLFDQDTPEDDQNRKQIVLQLREGAKRRLVEAGISPASLVVGIENILAVAFATGLTFAMTRVSINRSDGIVISYLELGEAIAALSHEHICYWSDLKAPEERLSPEFTLGSFVRLLAEGGADKGTPKRRAYSYSFARLTESIQPDRLDLLGSFLSRRYTSAYAFEPGDDTVRQVRAFSNVRHTVSTEGTATMIGPGDDGQLPEFLANWQAGVFLSVYGHLLLLALHEDWFLTVSRSLALDGRPNAAVRGRAEPILEKMVAILDASLTFRLCFRFSGVGSISTHTLFGLALRETFALDRKLSEMEGDVHAIAERLEIAQNAQIDEQADQRLRLYSIVSIFGLAPIAGLTTHSIVEEFLNVWPNFSLWASEVMGLSGDMSSAKIAFYTGCIGAGITLIATMLTGLPTALTRKTKGRMSVLAMTDQVRRGATK